VDNNVDIKGLNTISKSSVCNNATYAS